MSFYLFIASFLSMLPASSALTVLQYENESCKTYGDPSVYGPGMRAGFYLQFVASSLAIAFSPHQYSGSRIASVTVLWAILISSINSALTYEQLYREDGDGQWSVPVFEWTIVLYLVVGLFGANIPVGKSQMTSAAGAWVFATFAGCVAWGTIFHLYWTSLHDEGNFTLDPILNQPNSNFPGCEVHVAVLAPFGAFSNGWTVFNKVISIIACFVFIPLFAIFAVRLLHFSLKYGDFKAEELPGSKRSNVMRIIVSLFHAIFGILSIISIEVMVHVQEVDFGSDPFFSTTSHVAALIVGLICFCTVIWDIHQSRYAAGAGAAPPPPDFWSAGYAMKMVRLRK